MPAAATIRKGALLARLRSDRGSAMIEFSATASVFFLTLIGLMKICLAVYTYHYVSECARETTRYAIVHGSSSGGPVSTNDEIQTFARSLGYPGINTALLTTSTVWNTYPVSGGTCSPSTACNNPGNLVTVTVSYAFPLSIPYMSNKTWTMTSTSAMIIAN